MLKIAEVTSRFHSVGSFVLKVEKMGFKVISQVCIDLTLYISLFKAGKLACGRSVVLSRCLLKVHQVSSLAEINLMSLNDMKCVNWTINKIQIHSRPVLTTTRSLGHLATMSLVTKNRGLY